MAKEPELFTRGIHGYSQTEVILSHRGWGFSMETGPFWCPEATMQPVGIATSEGQDGTKGGCGETDLKDCEGQTDAKCLYGETRRKLKAKLKVSVTAGGKIRGRRKVQKMLSADCGIELRVAKVKTEPSAAG